MQQLDGNHRVTRITADVVSNVDFWCRILGLRFVKKALNFETTFRYHPYYGDEEGNPGSVVTFLEFNESPKGRPGRGNIQRAIFRVASYEALEFWMKRLTSEQVYSEMLRLDPTQPERLLFQDFEGHDVELVVSDVEDAPRSPEPTTSPRYFAFAASRGSVRTRITKSCGPSPSTWASRRRARASSCGAGRARRGGTSPGRRSGPLRS